MQPYRTLYVERAVIFDGIVSWCRWSDSNRNLRFSQNPVLDYYHSTSRGVQPHNCRTPIESGFFKCVSITRQYACNTNQIHQLLSRYPFTCTFTGTRKRLSQLICKPPLTGGSFLSLSFRFAFP